MRLFRMAAGASALAVMLSATAPMPARAESPLIDGLTLRTLSRLGTQYLLLVARTFVDLTYEHLTIDPHTGDTIITGLKLYPALDWDQKGECEIVIDRISSAEELGFDAARSRLELTGVTVAPACFDPAAAGTMVAFGYNGLTADSVAIDTSYEFGSSAADISIHAGVQEAAVVNINAAFDYVWLTGVIPNADNPSGEPYPVALLGEAEIAVENLGLFERLEPMLVGQIGDISAAPQMVQAILMEAISDGVTPPDQRAIAFVENVAAEVGRFVTEKNRLVVTVAPPGGVWLDETVFQTPASTIALLNPLVSQAPLASRALVDAQDLAAAIGGGSGLDDAGKLRVGAALLTGLGAPRSISHGQALLQPLADAWNAEAALLLAEALTEDGDPAAAYAMALRAAAGGQSRGITLADSLEEQMGAEALLAAQAASVAGWPGAATQQAADQEALQSADVGAMRERAHAAALGRGVPRSYADAYYWASLAAAAGDRSSAGLRGRIDARFAGAEGADRDAWKGVSLAAAGNAITTWTEGGLGSRIAALYGAAQ